MPRPHPALIRAERFAEAHGIQIPVLLAPMAGACPPSLSIAVAKAGGLGSCGALLMQPAAIRAWAAEVRAASNGAFQINLWIPGPAPHRDPEAEAALRTFLGEWGPPVAETAADSTPPDFDAQCEAMLEAAPPIVSSIMGLYAGPFVAKMKSRGIKWFATVTSVSDARAAEAAGADAIIAQGMEAGGHRGTFDPLAPDGGMTGLFSLLPAIAGAVTIPVIAAGGIADARGVAAALLLGASAVQVGTGFLRSPEAKIPTAWADAIGNSLPEDTCVTRAFSGRSGRSLVTPYVRATAAPDAPKPAPYPVQRGLTQGMRDAALKSNDLTGIQAWTGQSGGLAAAAPAGEIALGLWTGAQALLQ